MVGTIIKFWCYAIISEDIRRMIAFFLGIKNDNKKDEQMKRKRPKGETNTKHSRDIRKYLFRADTVNHERLSRLLNKVLHPKEKKEQYQALFMMYMDLKSSSIDDVATELNVTRKKAIALLQNARYRISRDEVFSQIKILSNPLLPTEFIED